MKRLFRNPAGLVLILVFILVACSSGDSIPGDGVTVRMGQATWDTGWFQAQVFKVMLEELGYEVRGPDTLENVDFFIFAAQGDVDFWANGWFPLHDRFLEFEQVGDAVRPVGFQVKGGALQGYLVDKATADKLGLSNLADLQDPEIAKVFDRDGDAKADLIGCNVEWACEKVIEHHLDVYGLGETVTQVQGDYSALASDVVERYANGESIIFYTWTPNWTVSELVIGEDVVWLGVPFSAVPDNPEADTKVDSIPGCLETPCDMGFEANDIRVVANANFLEANPAAATLFESIKIPLQDIAAQNVLMRGGENSEEDIRRHAEEWIESNHDQVDQWLAAARDPAG